MGDLLGSPGEFKSLCTTPNQGITARPTEEGRGPPEILNYITTAMDLPRLALRLILDRGFGHRNAKTRERMHQLLANYFETS